MTKEEKKAVEILEKACSELEKVHNNEANKTIRYFDDTRRKIMSKDIDAERKGKIANNVIKLESKIVEQTEKIKAIGNKVVIHTL